MPNDGEIVEGEEIVEIEENQLPSEEILELQESVNLLLEQQQEQQSQVTGIDQFVIDNADTITTALDVVIFWGVVGVPLVIIVVILVTVYDAFLYTRI